MFDFRYHALSLVAVFLALGIGIVLGVTIGDSVVSDANKGLRSSLRGDVVAARKAAKDAQANVSERDRWIDSAVPYLIDGRLLGERVALVSTGSLEGDIKKDVDSSVKDAGGTVDSTLDLALPAQTQDLASAMRVTLATDTDEQGLNLLGRRVARAIVRGRGLARVDKALPDRVDGDFTGADAVVLYRSPPPDDATEADNNARQAFENGLIQGLKRQNVPVVGVEATATEPSQIGFFNDRDVSSVDDVDMPGGRAALVLALNGQKGAFGVKGTADAPLPKLQGNGGG
ncbi:MAG TPA: copper transporter [Thermoleophilaceae bacterium]